MSCPTKWANMSSWAPAGLSSQGALLEVHTMTTPSATRASTTPASQSFWVMRWIVPCHQGFYYACKPCDMIWCVVWVWYSGLPPAARAATMPAIQIWHSGERRVPLTSRCTRYATRGSCCPVNVWRQGFPIPGQILKAQTALPPLQPSDWLPAKHMHIAMNNHCGLQAYKGVTHAPLQAYKGVAHAVLQACSPQSF